MFSFNLTNNLRIKIRKLSKKDKNKVIIINKKIKEIINNDEKTIKKYKNLKDKRRVHIDKHFVLTFKIDKENKFILFLDFEHHDKAY